MKGTVIEISPTNALVCLADGTTIDVGINHLPHNSKAGDKVIFDVTKTTTFTNDKNLGFF